MRMIGCLVRVSNEELKTFLEDASIFENLLFNEDEEEENLDEKTIDVDKAWDALIFMLGNNESGSKNLLDKILFSGNVLHEEQDLGYGPAHYLVSEDVKTVDHLLQSISDEDFMKKYEPSKMTEIYPSCWDDSAESKEYILEMFNTLKVFYATSAKHNEAVITYLC